MKVFNRACIGFIIIGLVVAVSGFAIGGGKQMYLDSSGIHLDSGEYQTIRRDFENFSSIDIRTHDHKLEVRRGEGHSVYASYIRTEPEIVIEEGVLKITASGFNGTFMNWGFNFKPQEIIVTIPYEAEMEYVAIENSDGSISLTGVRCSDKLNVDNQNGFIELDDIRALMIHTKNQNGGIKARNITTETATFSNENGRINIENFHGMKSNINNENGSIAVMGIDGRSVIRNQNGRVEARVNGIANYYMELSTKNGSVKVDGVRRNHFYRQGDKEFENGIEIYNHNGSISVYEQTVSE